MVRSALIFCVGVLNGMTSVRLSPPRMQWVDMTAHRTTHELEFIAGLYRKYQGNQRVEVFRTYVQALRLRTHWDGIDANSVRTYAEECLSKAWHEILPRN